MNLLYHYTCVHAADIVRVTRVLRPHTQSQLDGRKLIWLTDLEDATRAQLCLTSHLIACDRMEWRVVVDAAAAGAAGARRWPEYVRESFGPVRARRRAHQLSYVPGSAPGHWWVAESEIPVLAVAVSS